MVSNYECTANRKTYSQEADRGHGGLPRLLTTHLLLYPPASLIFLLFASLIFLPSASLIFLPFASLIFLLFASLATDVRRPYPLINNVSGCSEELIEELIFGRIR